jgi:hypothetical protein
MRIISWLYRTKQRLTQKALTNSINDVQKNIVFKPITENGQTDVPVCSFYGRNLILKLTSMENLPLQTQILTFFKPPYTTQINSTQYHITLMRSLPLSPTQKQREQHNMQYLTKANNFPYTYIHKLNLQIQRKEQSRFPQYFTQKQ